MTTYEIGQRVRTTIHVTGSTLGTSLFAGTLGTITELLCQNVGGGYGVLVDGNPSGIPLAYDHDELEAAPAPEGPR